MSTRLPDGSRVHVIIPPVPWGGANPVDPEIQAHSPFAARIWFGAPKKKWFDDGGDARAPVHRHRRQEQYPESAAARTARPRFSCAEVPIIAPRTVS